MESTGGEKEKVSTKEAVPDIWLVFGKIALWPMKIRAKREIEIITRLISISSSDEDELCRHVIRIENGKWNRDDTKDKELADKVFTKRAV